MGLTLKQNSNCCSGNHQDSKTQYGLPSQWSFIFLMWRQFFFFIHRKFLRCLRNIIRRTCPQMWADKSLFIDHVSESAHTSLIMCEFLAHTLLSFPVHHTPLKIFQSIEILPNSGRGYFESFADNLFLFFIHIFK